MKSFSWEDYAHFEERGVDDYGRVWSAIDSTNGAVIIHKLDLTQEQADELGLQTETMLGIHDPNVVGVVQVDSGQRMLVREAVNGITLRRYLDARTKLSQPVACAVMAQVASGWAAVQGAGLLVGDFRPENVLINLSVVPNQLRLGIFGVPALSMKDISFAYLAPELTRGEEPTQASDAYAFGATWYELLTGETPGAGLSPVDRLNFVPERPYGISSELWAILAPLLSVDPAARPTNAAELSMELFGLMATPAVAIVKNEVVSEEEGEGEDTLARSSMSPTNLLKTGQSWVRDNTFTAVLIAVAVAIVFMVILVVMMLNSITSLGDRIVEGVRTPTPVPSITEPATQTETPPSEESGSESETPGETSTEPTPSVIDPGLPSGATSCSDGLWVNGSTSCAFAGNVAASYASRGEGTYDVASPATGQTYSMTCSALNVRTVACRGGNGAEVFIVR